MRGGKKGVMGDKKRNIGIGGRDIYIRAGKEETSMYEQKERRDFSKERTKLVMKGRLMAI
jgi:hypothetical protein